MDKDVLDRFDKLWAAISHVETDHAVLQHRVEDVEKNLAERCQCGTNGGNGNRNRRVAKYGVAGGGGIVTVVVILETVMGYLLSLIHI